MKIFILEDSPMRIQSFQRILNNHELTIISHALEAIEELKKDLDYDVFFLDHDLGGELLADISEENTGSTVAKFLTDKDIKGDIIIHSFNSRGAANMMSYLPKAYYIPFNIDFLLEIQN